MSSQHFEPSATAYAHRFTVAPSDIDELGHANNVVWVRWVNEAALAHARHVGMGPEACQALGLVWVVRRHDLAYLRSAYAGETLVATTWAHTLRAASSVRRTLFTRDGEVLAQCETTWALIDTKTGRPTRVPPAMLAAYGFADAPLSS